MFPHYHIKNKATEGLYRAFIIQELAKWTSYKVIHNKLSDPEAFEKYGFPPYEGSFNALNKRCRRVPKDIIQKERDIWLAELREIPLAQKKIRILALIEIYNDADDEKIKLSALKQIKEEVGEEAFNEALKESGKTTVNVGISLKEEFKDLVNKKENRL